MYRPRLSAAEIRRRKRAGAYHDPRRPLTVKEIERLRADGRYRDGGPDSVGLYLQIKGQARTWLERFERHDRERWMGLGPYPLVGLKQARERARAARLKLLDGIDPIEERRAVKAKAKADAQRKVSFKEASRRFFDQRQAEWSKSHRDEFLRSLAAYAFEIIGDTDVSEIKREHVLRVLEHNNFWTDKRVTADRVRSRIKDVLDWCVARGYRDAGVNPAAWKESLKDALGKRASKVEHHAALPYADLPAFMARLRQSEGSAARSLEFEILTATRKGEALGARWSEIDLDDKMWIIPAERMKKGVREHKVPLSSQAIALIESLPREDGNPYLFVGLHPGTGVTSTAPNELLKRMGLHGVITVHGFRSTFSDWCHERTNFSFLAVETSLAHTVGKQVERAYRRTDMLDERRQLMAKWAEFCASPPAQTAGDVIPLRGAR